MSAFSEWILWNAYRACIVSISNTSFRVNIINLKIKLILYVASVGSLLSCFYFLLYPIFDYFWFPTFSDFLLFLISYFFRFPTFFFWFPTFSDFLLFLISYWSGLIWSGPVGSCLVWSGLFSYMSVS